MKKLGAWVKDTFLRSVKTAAQSGVALVTANTIGVTHVDWQHVGDVAGLAFVVCVLHNLATLQLTGDDATATVTVPAPIVVTTVTPAQPAAPVPDLDDPADIGDDDTPDNTDTVPPVQPAAPAAPPQ